MSVNTLTLVGGGLLIAGIALALLAGRLRLPSLVLFLGLGMAVGSDGTGWIAFNNYQLAQDIGIVALALILFEGGLGTAISELRPVLGPALALSFPGTIVTAAITGLVAAQLFDFTTTGGLLVGSIVAATDAAAVFAVLRGSTLRRRLARTLEGESGLNDPVAVLLVLGFIGFIKSRGYGVGDMVLLFVRQLGIGAAVGAAVGLLAVGGLRRVTLPSTALYPVVSLAAAGVAYGAAATAHGSGFLAVFLAGLMLGSADIPARAGMRIFHEALAWVAQIGMFFALGLLVFPAQLGDVAVTGTGLALVAVFVARPVATFLSLSVFKFAVRERLLLGWAGLRGAVPVVLATFPVLAGVAHSHTFFNIVFFAVLLSTILQGTTIDPLARALRLTTQQPSVPQQLVESGAIRALGADVVQFTVHDGDALVGRRVRDMQLPRDALVNVIVRRGEAIPPRGRTEIEAGDQLHILLRQTAADKLSDLQQAWRTGPLPVRPERRVAAPRAHPAAFTSGPWEPSFGDPAEPKLLLGVAVAEILRSRRDRRGALVSLADGRFAVTGPLLAVGNRGDLERYARQRLAIADTQDERAWWQAVIGELAA